MKTQSYAHVGGKLTSVIIALFLFPFLSSSQIVSAPGGGVWSTPSTWVGGIVPGAADNVVISSTVYANGNVCNNLQVNAGAVLQNYNAYTYNLTVNGDLINYGTISNNSSYSLNLYVRKNITNTGTISNYLVGITGAQNQFISSTQAIGVNIFQRSAAAGRLIATSNLSFTNTSIEFGNDTIEFSGSSQFIMSGGYLQSCIIYKAALPALKVTAGNGTYGNSATFSSPQTEFYGTLLLYGVNYFRNNFINYGTLQNHPSYTYTSYVQGNITNFGTIQNASSYSLVMEITGNMTNNGIWSNYETRLTGNGNQNLAMSQVYSGAVFRRYTGPGRVRATASISFSGTAIDFGTDTLEFTSGNTMTINGGYMYNTTLFRTSMPALVLNNSNGAYYNNVRINVQEALLEGTLQIYGSTNNFKGVIVNNGIIRNHPSYTYLLTINGNLINNGTLSDNIYSLQVDISGDMVNNGSITNYSFSLNGSSDQSISMSQPVACAYFTFQSGGGRLLATSDLSFLNTQISLSNDTLQFTNGSGLTFSGGRLSNGILFKSSSPAMKLTGLNGGYLESITTDAPQTELYGLITIYGSSSTFRNNVTNFGTLQNYSSYTYSLAVEGNLVNNGTIQNGTYYQLYINLSGNLTNNGIWRNAYTYLTGTSDRTFSFSERFEGAYLIKNTAAGNITAINDIIFDGVSINLNGGQLNLASSGYCNVYNGYLNNALIGGSDIHFKSLGAYCQNVTFLSDVTLHGVFQAVSGVQFSGDVVNEGTLRNYPSYSYSVTVLGDLENNSVIQNSNYYSLSLTILGNITNNGIWSNAYTLLDGTSDQYVDIVNNLPITGPLYLDANFSGGGFNWWGPSGSLVGNPSFSGANSQTLQFLTSVSNAQAGQYYCRNSQPANSRNIFIQSVSNPVRPLALNFLLEGLYSSNGLMNPSRDAGGNPVWTAGITDQITVELHDASNFANILFSKDEVLLSTSGNIAINVPAVLTSSYYIAIRHRSGIITVSANPVPFNTPTVTYSFNTPSAAYGSNMMQTGDGYTAFFSGDVNQDGVIDTADMTPVDNGSADYLGGYRNPDVNGDGIIDTADMTIVDNNSTNYVSAAYP